MTVRNTLYSLTHEAQRFADEYQLKYGAPVGHDGNVGTALLTLLRSLQVMACLVPSTDYQHLSRLIADTAIAAGFDGHPKSVGRL